MCFGWLVNKGIMEKFTKSDDDNMADLIWWIKGYLTAHKLQSESSVDFHEDHVQALIKYRLAHQDEIDKPNDKIV